MAASDAASFAIEASWSQHGRLSGQVAHMEMKMKLEGTPRAQTSVKAADQSPHVFVTPETFGP